MPGLQNKMFINDYEKKNRVYIIFKNKNTYYLIEIILVPKTWIFVNPYYD